MRNLPAILIALAATAGLMVLAAGGITEVAAQQGQSETDRLREALRTATTQARALEDQRNALQAKIAQVERDNAALKTEVNTAKAEVRQVKKDYREAVTQFNERLEERNQTLEKWKEAYAEAATVARTKDAERAQFEAEVNATKTDLKACTGKNQKLVKVGRELLAHYENVTLGDALLAQEPLIGIRRTQVESLLEDYAERVETETVPVGRAKSKR